MVSTDGLAIIGYFVWWTINKVRITREQFQEFVTKAGVDYTPRKSQQDAAAMRRSAFLKAQRSVNQSEKGLMIRKIKKQSDVYVFGLVDENVDKRAEQLNYQHTATMKFDVVHGNLSCDVSHRAYEEVKRLYEENQNYMDADDIRAVLLECLRKLHDVSCRGRGGFYFVSEKFRDQVESLEKLVELIDGGAGESFFSIAPQIDAESSKKAIHKAFILSLREKISMFRAELEEDTLKKRGLKNRIDDFKALREEIEFYQTALAFQAEDLAKELEDLTETVTDKLANA